ncbi:hypothetical protein BZG36_00490 [Bifiguratus adelaidae]|uniref:FAS1 domain-containing protein n=1 Tax=Bifiguratus adelaidae TaxID=1938954 RepID=A0A261Y7D3_9FUNG|nr:hypothetical protein BZG36_00490 [Bifiguratus adelaidae]
MYFAKLATLAAVLSLGVAAQSGNKTIVELALGTSEVSSLVKVLTSSPQYALIIQALNNTGNFTLFAPNNAAFAAAMDLTNILLYHASAAGAIASTDLMDGANVINSLATNTTVDNFGMNSGLPLDVVKNSNGVFVNYGLGNATVVTPDVKASNGIIHIIDKVLMLPMKPSATAKAANLTSLVSAVMATNLTDAIDSTQGITIFAPTNAAFATANAGSLSNSAVANILKYHVVPGDKINVSYTGGMVMVNNATVVMADVLTNNGVVHVIDQVLIPQDNSTMASASGSAKASGSGASAGNTLKVSIASMVIAGVVAGLMA